VDQEYQDVKRFFERPRLVTAVSASTTRNFIYGTDITEPISQFWPAIAANRLNGVLGYKATIKFTVTVAATPFQQGVIVAAFQYATWDGANRSMNRTKFSQLCTNVPHARLDFADATMTELCVPYCSYRNYFDIANTVSGGGDNAAHRYGAFAINQILPYATLSIAAPTIRLYISLHDMELFGAVPVTLSAVLPQSGLAEAAEKETRALVKNTGTAVRTMMGVPKISPALHKAAWLVDKVANVASSFGFSKPIDELPIRRRWATGYTYDGNVDQPSEAFVAGPYQSNRLVFDSKVTPSPVDEMSLKYVLGVYGQSFVGTLSTSDVGGTPLYATNVCPTSFWFKTNSGRPGGNTALPVSSSLTTNAFAPTTLCYISQMFRYWNGSIKFRFHFCKTKFHAGRLLAAFIPATYDTEGPAVLSNPVPTPENAGGLVQPFQYSKVFDLKDNNVFEIEVPYISSRPWISTLGSSGGLSLTVLDPLISSGETASTITYLVEVCAGDTFDLGSYFGNGLIPFVGLNPTGTIATLQSGIDVNNDEDVTQYTMGEKFSSIKELIQIPNTVTIQKAASGSGTSQTPCFPHWTVAPRFTYSIPAATTTSAYFTKSHHVALSSLYSFFSGGTIYNFYNTMGGIGFLAQVGIAAQDSALIAPVASTRSRALGSLPKVIVDNNGVTHFKLPSYQKAIRNPVEGSYTATNWALGDSTLDYQPDSTINSYATFNILNCFNTRTATNIGLAAADDSTLLGFIGPPICMLLQSTQTTDPEAANLTYYM
jgi:hypothetical protein